MKADPEVLLALKHRPKHFGLWLRERREAQRLSLRAMGAVLGLSPMFLCDLEHGRRHLTDQWLPGVARVLGVTTEEIVARRCEMEIDLATWIASHPKLLEWLRSLRDRDVTTTGLD